jgi:hypothetical protein
MKNSVIATNLHCSFQFVKQQKAAKSSKNATRCARPLSYQVAFLDKKE